MSTPAPYEAQNFDRLLGTTGLSETLLKNHFTLYQGYVKNTNLLLETFQKLSDEGKTTSPEFAELKRRFGWEFNGMRLHELYFGNMTATPSTPAPKEWEAEITEFKTMGAMRGIGWVVMVYDPVTKRVMNIWVNEHDIGHLVGGVPVLVMDVFEHAYMVDYGLKRADYIEAFMNAIDWDVVKKRMA